ncbi:leucine-rich transmembrane protein, putative [Pediculus humanus corporis]|uniref:Leucine-rich transmembrane protein, putative n=1 Tax=Pediculus humanus subsp. corporis TaxID=121224 RepID=E0VYT9_PEDHC|nr:leucine-rich transmembrane protein, putative [Pediculus humanus corporis]EEB18545.1 leucine-rich transmembrane protein, putative [Pediculus humanus corporis]
MVTVLDLSHNDIKSYSHWKYLKSVEKIDLSNNKITEVSFGGGSYDNLHSIDLSHNSIVYLNAIQIHKLKNLHDLNLSHNSKLHGVSGLKSDNLKILNLSYCYLSYLNDDFLADLPKIEYLDISHNPIKSLKNSVRSHSLQNLDASYLNMEALNKMDAFNMPGLRILNVSHNKNIKMMMLENYCWNVINLDVSNSESNYLKDFNIFCNLKILNASSNQIENIESNTFSNNVDLNFLNLSSNKITDVDESAFLNNKNLKIVDLSSNKINGLLFTYHLKQTINLNLSKNQITTLNGLVLKNCILLNLSKNKINDDIDMNLNERAPKLKIINLSFNNIQTVRRMESKSIDYIDLSYNHIEFVHFESFDNCYNLREINLIENKLKILDYRTFNDLISLKNLWLMRNPWSCDCFTREFKDLYEFLIVEKRFYDETDELLCVKTNKTFDNLDEGEEEISHRNSTPPPNYETAILLPKLTENNVREESRIISRNSLIVDNEVVTHVEEDN